MTALALGDARAAINEHHRLATALAGQVVELTGQAVDHARHAGALLLQVKDQLKYGEWLPWLAANVEVTARQAQRYMNAAQGKPVTVRAIANATSVSHLPAALESDSTGRPSKWTLEWLKESAPPESWAHFVEALGLSPTCGAILWNESGDVFVEPADEDGFYYAFRMFDEWKLVEHFGRPMNLGGVAMALDSFGAQRDRWTSTPDVAGLARIWRTVVTVKDADDPTCAAARRAGLVA